MAESAITPDTAYFERHGDSFHPRSIARGGWGPLISGHVVGGLLGWAVEEFVDDPEFLPARLTVDLPRPAAIAPVEVHTREIRGGKRLRLLPVFLIDCTALLIQLLSRTDRPIIRHISARLGTPTLVCSTTCVCASWTTTRAWSV